VTAPVPSPVWPDDATIERGGRARFIQEGNDPALWDDGVDREWKRAWREQSATVLSTVDPSGDTKLLAQIRETVDWWTDEAEKHPGSGWGVISRSAGFDQIAALLAGGGT